MIGCALGTVDAQKVQRACVCGWVGLHTQVHYHARTKEGGKRKGTLYLPDPHRAPACGRQCAQAEEVPDYRKGEPVHHSTGCGVCRRLEAAKQATQDEGTTP